jgi:hypothetical protein
MAKETYQANLLLESSFFFVTFVGSENLKKPGNSSGHMKIS